MPRTKINKANKRSRGINDEKSQELDLLVDSFLMEIEDNFIADQQNIETLLHKLKSQMPEKILHMKLADLEKLGVVQSFGDIAMSPVVNSNTVFISFQTSTSSTTSPVREKLRAQQSDEGYTTHEETNRVSRSSFNQMPILKVTGPFMSAQIKKRRSRSAQSSTGGSFTPQLNQMPASSQGNRLLLKRTKSGLLGSRPSRAKFRTPIMNGRLKAASADRLMITPKVQPNTPMALLRHARTGESVFSITGSPVITSVSGDKMANVNIPVGDSILSIRPTEMGSIDPTYISRIDQSTINHLKVLQQNINRIMETAGRAQNSF